jgi:hypothetical protein
MVGRMVTENKIQTTDRAGMNNERERKLYFSILKSMNQKITKGVAS